MLTPQTERMGQLENNQKSQAQIFLLSEADIA